MNSKQALHALNQIKETLREVRDSIKDMRPESPTEKVIFTAARQAVEAAEAELQSGIFALEMLDK